VFVPEGNCLLQDVETGFGDHPPLIFNGYRELFPREKSGLSIKLNIFIQWPV
jgi:hypothetical protein